MPPRSANQPDIDAAMPAAGMITIPGGREKSVMAAGRGMRVIVPITVGEVFAMIVVIVTVLVIAMLIRGLLAMLGRGPMLVRVVLRAYH